MLMNLDKIKVYLSARISKDAHEWNNAVCDALDDRIEVFKPHEHNPWNMDHRKLPKEVYEVDLEAMKWSNMGLLLTPYGRDCAWEVGWYNGAKKPIIIYAEQDDSWLRDWMVKGGVDLIVTANTELHDVLMNDSITCEKSVLISHRSELSEIFVKVCQSHSPDCKKILRVPVTEES